VRGRGEEKSRHGASARVGGAAPRALRARARAGARRVARGPGPRGRRARIRSGVWVARGAEKLRARPSVFPIGKLARGRAGVRVRGEAPPSGRPARTHRERHDAKARVSGERPPDRARLSSSPRGRDVGRRAARPRDRASDQSRRRASGASGCHARVPRVAGRERHSARIRGRASSVRAETRRSGRRRGRRRRLRVRRAIVARTRVRDVRHRKRRARVRRAARARRNHARRGRLPHDARAERCAAERDVRAFRAGPGRRDARRRVRRRRRRGRLFGAGVDARRRRAGERPSSDRRERVSRRRL